MNKLISFLMIILIFGCRDQDARLNCIDQQKKVMNIGIMCVDVYDPVCGCDSVTYSNSCWAGKAGVTHYVKGKCANCIDQQKKVRNIGIMCIEIINPVCGCDGVTYPNSCYADKAGVTRYAGGPCSH